MEGGEDGFGVFDGEVLPVFRGVVEFSEVEEGVGEAEGEVGLFEQGNPAQGPDEPGQGSGWGGQKSRDGQSEKDVGAGQAQVCNEGKSGESQSPP